MGIFKIKLRLTDRLWTDRDNAISICYNEVCVEYYQILSVLTVGRFLDPNPGRHDFVRQSVITNVGQRKGYGVYALFVGRTSMSDLIAKQKQSIALINVAMQLWLKASLWCVNSVVSNIIGRHRKSNGEVVAVAHEYAGTNSLKVELIAPRHIISVALLSVAKRARIGKVALVQRITACVLVQYGVSGATKFLSEIIGLARIAALALIRGIGYCYTPIILNPLLNFQTLNLRLAMV